MISTQYFRYYSQAFTSGPTTGVGSSIGFTSGATTGATFSSVIISWSTNKTFFSHHILDTIQL